MLSLALSDGDDDEEEDAFQSPNVYSNPFSFSRSEVDADSKDWCDDQVKESDLFEVSSGKPA